MRFDPKLVPPAEAPVDAQGELDLPDDLLELASQLRDDAAYLAAQFPASSPVVVADSVTRRRGLPRWARIGAAVAAALLLMLSFAYRPIASPREKASSSLPLPAGMPHLAVTEVMEPHATAPRADAAPAAVGPRIQHLPWAPTPALNEVSGPELEGLLDLWQNEQQVTETRISI